MHVFSGMYIIIKITIINTATAMEMSFPIAINELNYKSSRNWHIAFIHDDDDNEGYGCFFSICLPNSQLKSRHANLKSDKAYNNVTAFLKQSYN